MQSAEYFKNDCFSVIIWHKGISIEPSSLRTVRKDEGSQPVGGGDPPSRVPSSPDLTHDGPQVTTCNSKPCITGLVLTSVSGFWA